MLYKNDNMVLRYTEARHVVNIPNDCIYIHNQTKERYKIPSDKFDTFYYCMNYRTGIKKMRNTIRGFEESGVYEIYYKALYRRFNYNWQFDGVDSVVHRFRILVDLFNVKRFTPAINFDESSDDYLSPYWVLSKRERGDLVLG